MVSSLNSGAKQYLDRINQTLQNNTNNLGQLHNEANGIQNNLSSVESMLQGEKLAPDFLNQYINCDPSGDNYDYGNLFFDPNSFQPSNSGAPLVNGVPQMPLSGPPLDLDSLADLSPATPAQNNSIAAYDEDLEEIFTEPPPPQSSIGTMTSPSPAIYDPPN